MWAGAVYQLPSILAPALIYLGDEVRTKRVKAVGLRGRWSKSLAILLHVRFFSRFVALSRSAVPSPAQHTRPSVTRSASCVVVSRLGAGGWRCKAVASAGGYLPSTTKHREATKMMS